MADSLGAPGFSTRAKRPPVHSSPPPPPQWGHGICEPCICFMALWGHGSLTERSGALQWTHSSGDVGDADGLVCACAHEHTYGGVWGAGWGRSRKNFRGLHTYLDSL